LDGGFLGGHHRDRREPPFGSLLTRSNSIARREIASSVSNSAIRLFAATSSAFLEAGQARDEALVDAVLPPRGIDRLLINPRSCATSAMLRPVSIKVPHCLLMPGHQNPTITPWKPGHTRASGNAGAIQNATFLGTSLAALIAWISSALQRGG
jgi:hypothetical protein